MRNFQVYCDESCDDNNHAFMAVSGILLTVDMAEEFRDEIVRWRQRTGMHGEMKWTKVSRKKLDDYKSFTKLTIDRTKSGICSFRSIVLEKRLIKWNEFHQGDEHVGLYKFMYQLILHCFIRQKMNGDDVLTVFVDRKDTKYKLSELLNALRNGSRYWMGANAPKIKTVIPVESKASQIIQANDVLLGAVGFHNNQRDLLPETKAEKKELAAFIASEAGLSTLRTQTPPFMAGFGIWQFDLTRK
jgi:hypothetical protein